MRLVGDEMHNPTWKKKTRSCGATVETFQADSTIGATLKSQFAFRWVVVASSSPVESLGRDCTRTRERVVVPQIERSQLRGRDGHVSRACTYVLSYEGCRMGMYTRVYVHVCRRIGLTKRPRSLDRDANEGTNARRRMRQALTRIRSLHRVLLTLSPSSGASIFARTGAWCWRYFYLSLSLVSLSLYEIFFYIICKYQHRKNCSLVLW